MKKHTFLNSLLMAWAIMIFWNSNSHAMTHASRPQLIINPLVLELPAEELEQNRTLLLAERLFPFFNENDPGAHHMSYFDLISFARGLVHAVENNRDLLNSDKTTMGHFRIGTTLRSDRLPCSVHVLPNGRIIVYLKSIEIHGKRYELRPLGTGTFKKFSLGFYYDEMVQPEGVLNPMDSFLAIGRIRLPLEKNGQFDLSTLLKRHDVCIEEFTLHKSLSRHPGISQCYTMLEYFSGKHLDLKRIDVVNRFYLTDLYSFRMTLSEQELTRIRTSLALDLLTGLVALHKRGIHHRDIKDSNVLIDFDENNVPRASLTDFGWALRIHCSDAEILKTRFAGTPCFMAPEYVKRCCGGKALNANRDLKNDVWSMGIILYQLANPQWHESLPANDRQIFKELMSIKNYDDLKSVLGMEFQTPQEKGTFENVVYRMLNPDSEKRISAETALALMEEVAKNEYQN